MLRAGLIMGAKGLHLLLGHPGFPRDWLFGVYLLRLKIASGGRPVVAGYKGM
jgi:hypothetical protein